MPDVAPSASPYALLLAQEHYTELIESCEQAIAADPENVTPYWYLGLAQLLAEQEAAAQLTWMTPLLEAEPEQAQQWTTELVQVLQTAAEQQESHAFYDTAWALRHYVREFAPGDLANLLHLVQLGIQTGTFAYEAELLRSITEELQQRELSGEEANLDRLLTTIQHLLAFNPEHIAFFQLLDAAVPWFRQAGRLGEFLHFLLTEAHQFRQVSRYTPAIHLAKFCARHAPKNSPEESQILLSAVSIMQSDSDSMLDSLPITERLIEIAPDLCDRILATHLMLGSLMMTCSSWQAAQQYYQLHQSLLASAVETTSAGDLHRLLASGMYFPYFGDSPAQDRPLRNQIAQVSQDSYRSLMLGSKQQVYHSSRVSAETKKLKIGYLSECLRVHSVGWLARWLLQYHDRDQFDIFLYSTKHSNDPLQVALMQLYGDRFHHLSLAPEQIADRIAQDEIDILVELDSLTSYSNCAVATLKPAPIQVSWLGFDASGLPAIDYYIADPYVLPEDAQNYYQEKIWRLPQTYIAVDGFEVGVPELRRDHLGIPADAVVYLSSQSGLKRNPENVRTQLQILQQVPNSYFLIKSFNAQPDRLQAFFFQMAEEVGISGDRLRFLPDFASNAVYRASLGLADVILDTYPYNGATTTLEALWMGVPIVTRVGEQFAARNSYTMLRNVGISEGIAWSEAEYLEWGTKLGLDAKLRSKINYQLRRSRQSAPLWNTRRFAQDMEQAYRQMWVQF